MMLKIVSGGQTGVDRAALDWAIAIGLPHGGWCPRERAAEDGTIAPEYALVETVSRDYIVRTRLNVEASDATLILNRGALEGGTRQTADFAEALARPYLVVALDAPDRSAEIAWARCWLEKHSPLVLNVAGPRESGRPGIGEQAYGFLEALFGDDMGVPRPPLRGRCPPSAPTRLGLPGRFLQRYLPKRATRQHPPASGLDHRT